jgi:hypothetical protein
MTLEEFVRESLMQIRVGVSAARDRHPLNIGVGIAKADDRKVGFITVDGHVGLLVEFDVAVTVSEKTGNEVGGGLQIAQMFSAGGKKSGESKTSSVSRIRFSVPVVH